MEPGHEDREESPHHFARATFDSPQWSPVTRTGKSSPGDLRPLRFLGPQWSPVTRTGKRETRGLQDPRVGVAAMEPGHEDREELEAVQ